LTHEPKKEMYDPQPKKTCQVKNNFLCFFYSQKKRKGRRPTQKKPTKEVGGTATTNKKKKGGMLPDTLLVLPWHHRIPDAARPALRDIAQQTIQDALRDNMSLEAKRVAEATRAVGGCSLQWAAWALNLHVLEILEALEASNAEKPAGDPCRGAGVAVRAELQTEQTRNSRVVHAWHPTFGEVCVKQVTLGDKSLPDQPENAHRLLDSSSIKELACAQALRKAWQNDAAEACCPCVLPLRAVLGESKLFTLFPWVEGRTVENLVFSDLAEAGSTASALQAAHDLQGALRLLRRAGVSHNDLKSDNVMYDARHKMFRLIDFDSGTTDANVNAGTHVPVDLLWMGAYRARPPERLALCLSKKTNAIDGAGGFASDAWAAGMLLVQLWRGRNGIHRPPGWWSGKGDGGDAKTPPVPEEEEEEEEDEDTVALDRIRQVAELTALRAGIQWGQKPDPAGFPTVVEFGKLAQAKLSSERKQSDTDMADCQIAVAIAGLLQWDPVRRAEFVVASKEKIGDDGGPHTPKSDRTGAAAAAAAGHRRRCRHKVNRRKVAFGRKRALDSTSRVRHKQN
jgi:hypothetical protein